jgi:hypothetical protein
MLPRFAVLFILAVPAVLHGALTVTSLASSANPAVFGHPVTLTAVVSPNPGSGTVTFYSGVTVLETEPLTSGKAAFTTSLLPFGAQSLKARYDGNSLYSSSTSLPLSQTVNAVEGYGFQDTALAGPFGVSLAVGDFNGDGRADVAVVDSSGSKVDVLLGNGDGTFQPFTSYAVAGASCVTVGDFNGDGKSDLAVGSSSGIAVLLGTGNGAFQAVIYSAGNSPGSLLVTDFNGDGKADLALSDQGGVAVMLGNGDGTFRQPVPYTIPGYPAIALADFNGDGIADISYSEPPGVGVLLGNGDGTFRAAGTYSMGIIPSPLVVSDFNGDGKADIAFVAEDGGGVWVYLGNGDGTLRAPVIFGGYDLYFAIAVGDFNGDGKPDLAITNASVNALSVFMGNGDGTFQTALNNSAPGAADLGSLVIEDLNGDGRIDIAGTGNGVSIFLALGPPTTTTLESSPNPSSYAESVTLTASVSPATATGGVTFYDGSTALGTSPIASGVASISLTTLAVGTHSLTAVYGGDSNEASSTSPVVTQTVTVRPTTTTLASSPNPSNHGQTVTLTATVSPSTATGTVTFYNQSTALGTGVLSGGAATLPISTLVVGTFFLSATYGGDTNDGASNALPVTQNVYAVVTSTVLTSSPNPSTFGQTVKLTATVSPATATGTVTFYHGDNSLGTVKLKGGQAALGVSTLGTGSIALTASYSGDDFDLASTSPVITEIVNTASTTTLSSSLNPSNYRQSVTLTAMVSPSTATGTVTFYRGTTSLGTGTLSGGAATLTTASLPAGLIALKAVYGGDANDSPSTSSVLNQEVRATSSTALKSSPNPSTTGQTVTLTATVTPSTATGSVTFYHGSTAMGNVTLTSGTATFTTSTLTKGTHSLTATYGGDTNDAPSTSPVLNQSVQ